MPTVRIGQSKVIPFFPSSNSIRRTHYSYLIGSSNGEFFKEHSDIFNDDYSWWANERLPNEDSDRRIRISARNYNEAINQLSEYDLKSFTRLDNRTISNPKNILRLIVIAFNTYSELKLHFVEEAPRSIDDRIIGYHTDYIRIHDNEPNSFKDIFQGRCLVTLDSNIIRSLLYDISKNEWQSFWIKITGLYESIFNHSNNEIDEPKHLKIKYGRTKLEDEYVSRKNEATPEKYDLIYLLENMILPEDAYIKIMNILKRDPNITELDKKELELC